MDGVVVVDAQGCSRWLAMLWKEDSSLKLLSFSKYHILIEVVDQKGKEWRLTGFHGDPNNSM